MQNPYSRYQQTQEMKATSKRKVTKVSLSKRSKSFQKSKRRSKDDSINWTMMSLCAFGLLSSFYTFTHTDEVMTMFSKIQVGMTVSNAAEEEEIAEMEAETNKTEGSLPVGKVTQPVTSDNQLTMKNANVFKALRDKARELEKKERRLAQLEEELQQQKTEIEKQLKDMQEMRRNISSKLDKKEVADQKSIDKLVGVYSSMKPQNAALIFTQLDDALAVQILDKMKKQSAAAILNYIEPKKARSLSEKFTGVKK